MIVLITNNFNNNSDSNNNDNNDNNNYKVENKKIKRGLLQKKITKKMWKNIELINERNNWFKNRRR